MGILICSLPSHGQTQRVSLARGPVVVFHYVITCPFPSLPCTDTTIFSGTWSTNGIPLYDYMPVLFPPTHRHNDIPWHVVHSQCSTVWLHACSLPSHAQTGRFSLARGPLAVFHCMITCPFSSLPHTDTTIFPGTWSIHSVPLSECMPVLFPPTYRHNDFPWHVVYSQCSTVWVYACSLPSHVQTNDFPWHVVYSQCSTAWVYACSLPSHAQTQRFSMARDDRLRGSHGRLGHAQEYVGLFSAQTG